MAQHTPGPWVARRAPYGWDLFNQELGVWIGNTASPLWKDSPFYPSVAECEANAALMAESPMLQAEVQELRRALLDAITVFEISPTTQFRSAYQAVISRAESAIDLSCPIGA